MTMPDLFDAYSEAVESQAWNFALTCSLAEISEDEAQSDLGCRDDYGLLGYLEVVWGISDMDPEDF